MKQLFKIAQLGILLIVISINAFSQDISLVKQCDFDSASLTAKWLKLNKNKGWLVLQQHLKARGYLQLKNSSAMYGFDAITSQNKSVEFYVYDFNKNNDSAASLIYRNDGSSTYIAVIYLPKDEKYFFKALEKADEYYSSSDGKIQKANSWKSCFKKCAQKRCPSWCLGSIVPCTMAGAVLVGAGGWPGVAFFFGCTIVSCASCFGMCAVSCL